MTIAYEYIGDGAFVVDDLPVPARNITEDELTDELRAVIELNIAGPACVYRRVEQSLTEVTKPVKKKTGASDLQEG